VTPRRIAVVGSRGYPRLDDVRVYVRTIERSATVISGGARGVDIVAVDEARRLGMECETYHADWTKGRGAGFARNAVLVERATEVVAFWDGVSKGTAHTIALARKAGKPVTVFDSSQEGL
jgi:hypothetical protein